MKKLAKSRPLSLGKETVRTLDDATLPHAAGGRAPPYSEQLGCGTSGATGFCQ